MREYYVHVIINKIFLHAIAAIKSVMERYIAHYYLKPTKFYRNLINMRITTFSQCGLPAANLTWSLFHFLKNVRHGGNFESVVFPNKKRYSPHVNNLLN